MEVNRENCVEWITGEKYCTGSFTQKSRITHMKKLYKQRPEEFVYFHENEDGSICCKYPLKWEKQNAGALPGAQKRVMTDEQKRALAEGRARKAANKNL